MIDHELTDPAGGALTITHDHQGVWVTATEDRDEVTVGPFPAGVLHDALDEATPPDTLGDIAGRVRRLLAGAVNELEGDLIDGGVTAAAIEAEVVSPDRARSLVQENTELRSRIGRVEEARDLYRQDVMTAERREQEFADRAEKAEQERDRWREYRDGQATENPRPLTADDYQRGEMAALAAFVGPKLSIPINALVRAIVTEVLTPPPPRPEGAEGLDEVLRTFPGTLAGVRDISDHLASHGVRAGGDS